METVKNLSKKAIKKGEQAIKIAPKTDTSKVYELSYIFVPTISDDRALVEEKVLADFFTQNGGDMISSEHPVLIDLTYPMLKVIHTHREKCFKGHFGWMKFEIETEAIAAVKKLLDAHESVVRYLLVKTVRENTLLTGKMTLVKEERTRKSPQAVVEEEIVAEVEVDVAPVNPEELDKSIDELVIA